MPSATEPIAPDKSPKVARFRAGFERWNRKLHYYAGLFLLFFVWLFAFSGLLLNHPTWSFAESWNNRKESNYEREMTVPGPEVKGDLAQAREILGPLGIEGEILWTTTRTDVNLFDFKVRRPGMHTFTGVQLDDPRQSRDWALTSLWAFSMDVVAAGLIFMVLSSLYMWFKLPQKRISGAVVLGLGTLICGLFCVGLRRLF